MATYHSILVPTDGSVHAARALAQADYLAAAMDATVHLLHVVDIDAEAGPFAAGGINEAFVERHREAGGEVVAAAAKGVEHAERVETAVRTGKPTEAILSYAIEADIDLLAVGTHGRTGLDRYVLGSVAERVVRRTDRPVLTARAPEAETPVADYEEILVATDGSAPAQAAAEAAAGVAADTGASVHAVSVVNTAALAAGPDGVMLDAVLSELRSASEDATDAVVDLAESRGVEATGEVAEGRPAEAILDAAADTDLVVMGTTGRTGAARILLGSTTAQVLRQADPPVLSVHAPASEE